MAQTTIRRQAAMLFGVLAAALGAITWFMGAAFLLTAGPAILFGITAVVLAQTAVPNHKVATRLGSLGILLPLLFYAFIWVLKNF